MFGCIHSEYSKCSSHNIGSLLETSGLDDTPDVPAGPLHVHLQLLGLPRLGQHLQGGGGELPVLPEVVVNAVAGPDHLGKLGLPLVAGEVLGVGVTGPKALEDDLSILSVSSSLSLSLS